MKRARSLGILWVAFVAGCGGGSEESKPADGATAAESGTLEDRESEGIADAVDATITHKTQIEAGQQSLEKLNALDQQRQRDLAENQEP